MRGDLSIRGFSQTLKRPIAAATTRFYAGEPLHSLATNTAGAVSAVGYVPAAADTPVIGTHRLGGICIQEPVGTSLTSATVGAQHVACSLPIADLGKIRGVGDIAANIATDTLLTAMEGNFVLIKYAATGSVNSGPLYTLRTTASANTSGLEIVGGNSALGFLDVVVDPRAIRNAIS